MASSANGHKQRLSAQQASQLIQSWVQSGRDNEEEFSSSDDSLEFDIDKDQSSESDNSDSSEKGAAPQAGPSRDRGREGINERIQEPLTERGDRDRSRSQLSRPVATTTEEEYIWSEVDSGSTMNAFRFVPPQGRVSGVNSDIVPDDSSALSCLKALFTDDIMEELVLSINGYADQRCQAKMETMSSRSVYRKWVPVTLGELYKFFAVIIAMGIVKKPSVSSYWSHEPYMQTPWFRQMFTRDRFQALYHTMFHVSDVDAEGKAKIEPFVNKLLSRFQEAFYPFKELSLDEMVIGWKGRWAYKMFNASKPKKYHVKTFGLCDSTTGYVVNLLIYFGTNTSYSADVDDKSQQAIKVFDTLLKPCGKGHHLYADRYYTSLPLLKYLTDNSQYFTGTVNINRKYFPKVLKTTQLMHMQMKWFIEKEKRFLCVAFRDKKAKKHCILVSSCASVESKEITNRSGDTKQKPAMIDEYNLKMNGCDRVDQCVTTYGTFNRRTRKWWKKIFYWIFEISQLNALVLFALTRKENSKKQSLLQFKNLLITELSLAAALEIRDIPGTIGHANEFNNPVNRLGGTNHCVKRGSTCRNCVVCSTTAKRIRTSFYCLGCSNHPHLHPDECFAIYHQKAVL